MTSPKPTHEETVRHVADALVELRRDNAVLLPEDRVNEETFVIGAIRLYMGEENAPIGCSMQSMAGTVKNVARVWMSK